MIFLHRISCKTADWVAHTHFKWENGESFVFYLVKQDTCTTGAQLCISVAEWLHNGWKRALIHIFFCWFFRMIWSRTWAEPVWSGYSGTKPLRGEVWPLLTMIFPKPIPSGFVHKSNQTLSIAGQKTVVWIIKINHQMHFGRQQKMMLSCR